MARTRLAWATDVHWTHAPGWARAKFAQEVRAVDAEMLLITGDIASASSIERSLVDIHKRVELPIVFNLGNHDFYGASINTVRTWSSAFSDAKIHWAEGSPVHVSGDTAIVGVDGWGDGRLGDYESSPVLLNDWFHIDDFAAENDPRDRTARLAILRRLGDEAAEVTRMRLGSALRDYRHLLLMTHVPPWKEAAWHQGKHSGDDWLPWFTCKAVGDAIVDEVANHPGKRVTVICGHTHGVGYSRVNEQIDVYTGGAEYGTPCVAGVFECGDGVVSYRGSEPSPR